MREGYREVTLPGDDVTYTKALGLELDASGFGMGIRIENRCSP
jgi:hypothetical protein